MLYKRCNLEALHEGVNYPLKLGIIIMGYA
jgi:hypothetical protein